MFNTISNFTRKADKYGDIHFISFLSAVLSRIAYFDDNKFLTKYNAIMGPVIQDRILQGINNVDPNNLSDLFDDQKIFGLNKDSNDIFQQYEYDYKGKNFIDFLALNMPQNINIINEDLTGTLNYPIPGQQSPDSVKYISIGWSNYGEIFIVADKRMPNTIFVIFRGTYSAKTAALYTKPTSITPLTVCTDSLGNKEQFLYGIFKPTTEMIHTIIEATLYLAVNFLGATQPNSVKIFTTGHSLGGAMCSNFAYLWMGIKKTPPYNNSPYSVLAENIVCVSLGAPRCMSKLVARKFCNFVSQKKILFLRITTRGDPVTGVPGYGFEHPCSDDSKMRMEISEACSPQLTMRPNPNINYKGDLDCQNYKTRINIPNPLSHTVYLDIIYTKAVDIIRFLKGMGISQEVLRTLDKSTVCRLVMGNQSEGYKAVFFNVNRAREAPTKTDIAEEVQLAKVDPNAVKELTSQSGSGFYDTNFKAHYDKMSSAVSNMKMPNINIPGIKIGGPVAEDRRMTTEAFNTLINQMEPLTGNLCPQKGKMVIPFNNKIMPDLSCPGSKFGGARTRRYKKTKKTLKKKSKKRRTNRRK